MLMLDRDRRCHPRIAIERPCKIHDPRTGRYYPGTVLDVSAAGMMIRIERDLGLVVGDELFVGIAQKRRQVLLRTDEMFSVRVARIAGSAEGWWAVGAELIENIQLDPEVLRLAA